METSFFSGSVAEGAGLVVPREPDNDAALQLRAGVLRAPTQADEEHREATTPAASQPRTRSGIRVLALSSDSATLVAAGDTGDIETWDLRRNKRIHILRRAHGHGACRALDVSPDDRYIISAGVADKRLKVWPLHPDNEDEDARERTTKSSSTDHHDGEVQHPLAMMHAGCAAMAVVTWPDDTATSTDSSACYLACGGDSKDDHVHIWTCTTTTAKDTSTASPTPKTRSKEDLAMKKVASLKGTGGVRCMVYDKQHGRIFAGNKKDTIDVWYEHMWRQHTTHEEDDVPSIPAMASFAGHTGWLNALAISAEGNWLISGSGDKTIKVWNVAPPPTQQHQHQQQHHQQQLSSSSSSSPSSSPSSSASVPDSSSSSASSSSSSSPALGGFGRCFATLRGHTSWVNSIVVTRDFRRIISGAWDGEIKVWIVEAQECLATLTSNKTNTPALVLSPQTDRYFISGSISGAIRIWDTDLTSDVGVHHYPNKVNSVALAPNSRELAICAGPRVFVRPVSHHTLYKKDASAVLQGASTKQHAGTDGVALPPSSQSSHAVCGATARRDTAQQREESTGLSSFADNPAPPELGNHPPPTTPRAFLQFDVDSGSNPSGRRRGESNSSMGMQMDAATDNVELEVPVSEKKFNTIRYSHDGSRLFAAHETGRIFIASRRADSGGFGPLEDLAEECHQCELRAMDVSERYLVSGDRGDETHAPKLIVWDPVKRESVAQHSLPVGEKINCIAIAPDDTCVAVGCGEFGLRVYSLPELREEAALIPNVGGRKVHSDEHRGRVSSLLFLSDSRRLVSGSDDNTVKVWALNTRHDPRAEGAHNEEDAPDTMRTSLTCLATFEGHTANVTSLGASPGDRYLVTASQDTTVKVWDLQSLELAHCTVSLKGHSSIVWVTTVCRRGQFIVSGSQDKTVRVWPLAQLLSPDHFHGLPHLPTFTLPGTIEHDHRDADPTHRLSTLRRAMAAFPLTLMFPMPANSSINTVSASNDEEGLVRWNPLGTHAVNRTHASPAGDSSKDGRGPYAVATDNHDTPPNQGEPGNHAGVTTAMPPAAAAAATVHAGAVDMEHVGPLAWAARNDDRLDILRVLLQTPKLPLLEMGEGGVGRMFHDAVHSPTASDMTVRVVVGQLIASARAQDAGVERPELPVYWRLSLTSLDSASRKAGNKRGSDANHSDRAPGAAVSAGDGDVMGTRSMGGNCCGPGRSIAEDTESCMPEFTKDIIGCMADHRGVACDLLRGLGLVRVNAKAPRVGPGDPYIPSERLYVMDGGSDVVVQQEQDKRAADMDTTRQRQGWTTPLRWVAERWSRHETHKKEREAQREELHKAQRWDLRVVPIPHASRFLLPALVKRDDVFLFDNAIARALIAFKWRRHGRAEFMQRLLIYLISLACATALVFTANLNGATAMELFTSSSGTDITSAILVLVLMLIALWESTYEVKQLVHDVEVYVSDVWNWVDAGNVVLVLLMTTTYFGGWIHARIFLALCVFLRWYGLLYFLQAFHTTGPLVRMIVAIAYDVRHFLLVLFIAILASWTAIHALLRGQADEDLDSDAMQRTANGLLLTFSMLILVEFDLEALTGSYTWLLRALFVVSMVLVPLVLLNLLIALMSDSYERIKDHADVEFQLLRAKILVEQEGFMRREQKQDPHLFPKWLYCVVRHDHTEALAEEQAEWKGVLHDIKANTSQTVDQATLKLMQRLDEVEHTVTKLPAHIAAANTS